MFEIKTDKELLIEFRNKIAGRIIEARANTAYFQEVVKNDKQNSQEIVEHRLKLQINEQNIKQDKIFLRVIDLMLKKEK
jgi:DNA-directed RNA polymerase subunit F